MKKIYLLLVLLFSVNWISQSQELKLSAYSEVSIFTCGPGDALFETFGHNAIRVKDPVLRLDLVFNYGTFDFRDPNFYSNFAQGRLEYWVSLTTYPNFEYNYKAQKRWIKEQILDLTQQEKQAFFDFLRVNALPENRNYLYDPFYDNCSTKLRDITQQVLNNEVIFGADHAKENLSLRQIMNDELPWNTWGSFGINIALGSKLDKVMTPEEYMYLPDFLYLAFKDAKRGEQALVKKENVILDFEERPFNIGLFSPMTIFSILFVLVLWMTFRDYKRQKRSKILDFSIFFVTGLIGVFLVFLSFFTDHKTTPNNFNLLWAFTPNLIVGFFLLKRSIRKWIKNYIKVCLLLVILVFVIWLVKLQLFTLAFLPILGILVVRYGFVSFLLSSEE